MITGKLIQFSASRISDLLAGGSGKTRLNYIYELAEKSLGIDNRAQTKAMQHGINNEMYALNVLFQTLGEGYSNDDGQGNQVYFKINEYVGATPDALSDNWVGDAKCQFYIRTFFEQNDKLVKRYYDQLQCQMLALKVDKAYLINYLTKPEVWGQDDWTEYPFALEDRFFIHEVEKDEAVQNDILELSEKYFPYIGLGAEMMRSAVELNEIEYFGKQFYDKVRFRKLKEINWIENDSEVFRFDNEFFVIK